MQHSLCHDSLPPRHLCYVRQFPLECSTLLYRNDFILCCTSSILRNCRGNVLPTPQKKKKKKPYLFNRLTFGMMSMVIIIILKVDDFSMQFIFINRGEKMGSGGLH